VGDKDTDLTEGMANRDHSTGNLIEGVAKFMWPTPDAANRARSAETQEKCKRHRKEKYGKNTAPIYLEDAASLWATPTTQDAKNDGPPSQAASSSPPLNAQVGQMWLTPHGMAGVDSSGKEGSGGEFAGQATRFMEGNLWMTPTARATHDCPAERASSSPALESQANLSSLPDQQIETHGEPSLPPPPGSPLPSPRKRLNPRFVEWLMGLPPGWVTGRVELTNFGCWEMESYRHVGRLLS
jgi:hypothetical protein